MAITAQLVKELREKTGAGMMDCKQALVATNANLEEAIDWLREKGISKAAKKQSRIAAEGLTEIKIDGNKALIFELNSETDFVTKNDMFLNLLDQVGDAILGSGATDLEAALVSKYDGKEVQELLQEATFVIGEKISLRRIELVEKTDAQVFGAYKHMGGRISVLALFDGSDADTAKDVAMHIAAINPPYLSSDSIPSDVIEKEREVQIQTALNENAESAKPKPENIIQNMVNGRMNKFLKDIVLLEQPFVKESDYTVGKFLEMKNLVALSFTRYEVGEGMEKKVDDFAAEVAAQAAL